MSSTGGLYRCDICGVEFGSQEECEKHTKEVHGMGSSYCSKIK